MWVIICKNNPIHTHTWNAAQSPIPLPTPTNGDEFTASKRVRVQPFVANIWLTAKPLPPSPSLVHPPHIQTAMS